MDVQERVGLPSAFEDVDIDHLAILIADMLSRLTEHNDKIPLLPDSLTRFHSRSPPAITVLEYLRRIIKFTNVEKSCLLLILFCIDLVCARQPLFTISSLTCHRFIISSITICSKGICDSFCSNSIYAKVGGITISELNLLEREFLQFTEWRLYCTREILQEYYVNLIRAHSTGAYTILAADTSIAIRTMTPIRHPSQPRPP
ncbi:cyclin-domain-containing protein [Pterulicium gracile]|uniref:Cyclin-domain-containing protein n=1 Tax=Pterulicium gracile TaxID=1884261 RepID=A0A5C3QG52_9AGAR|nr:cyclin-domain-containing protein [Pterula gracilis]